jgi:hypothetical protein
VTQREQTAPGRGPRAADPDRLRHDASRLAALVARLPADDAADAHRDLRAMDAASDRGALHLRAVTALLVSLDTWVRGQRRPPPGELPVSASSEAAATPRDAPVDPVLAAAAARYIARDLAARRLSEFTSAEGYRLARALAAIGGVREPVEQLLADANTVRLHPMPLTDAMSHSAAG